MEQKPPITISTLDAARLERMLDSLGNDQILNKEDLQIELDRANVVYPNDIGDGAGKISVLAPVGSALLGLREGDAISWPKPGGGLLMVRILKIVYQPERAGDFRR